ncbi:hypothetical protein HYH02_012559 [Chlamydomonas schloesseri]|uniref:Transcription initiation factor IIE subunit alpha N-terminal domain-containing protein n=1 Tax=Chlamydomonas schloesseri TaxID=2026947 RepID=A0A835VZH7_9CHLO|nr:hypothetical protein HYH02_012559 [Chlamydomonas schloesseri]|eukprot:KAG2433630.1 hypothetical protein HYH02_012559 [Chlamydomonas schloesseri]
MSFAVGGAGGGGGGGGPLGGGYAPVTYQRLMRLAARAFYSGPCPPPGRDLEPFSNKSKIAKMDTRGLGVVLVDYLTTVEWTSFDLLAEALKLHPVMLSRALRFLEQGHMLRRYERRESRRKKRNLVGEALEADVAAPAQDSDEDSEDEEGAAKKKGLLTEYFTLDYARAFDAVQIRITTMRNSLKEQLESSNAIQSYRCPRPYCGKAYTSLDAATLVDPMDGLFKCELCGEELAEQRATNDAGAAAGGAGGTAGQHATAKESKEAARRVLQAMERELAPITRLMADLQARAVPLPDPGELFEWAQRVRQREAELEAAAAKAAGGGGGGGGRGGGGGGGGASNPAALLAGSGVTVLNAADNTNTWESQDFKVSLADGASGGGLLTGGLLTGGLLGSPTGGAAVGGAGGGAGGGGGGGGRKPPTMLPWFMKGGAAKEGAEGGEGGDGVKTEGGGAADKAKQQQQAEYFKKFMADMSKVQQEKKAQQAVAGGAGGATAAAPWLAGSSAAGGAAAPFAGFGGVKAEPQPAVAAAAGAAAVAPGGVVVKTEPGLVPPPLPAAAPQLLQPKAESVQDVEWEDAPAPVKLEGLKPDPVAPGGGGAAAGGAMDVDAGDVEWEDVLLVMAVLGVYIAVVIDTYNSSEDSFAWGAFAIIAVSVVAAWALVASTAVQCVCGAPQSTGGACSFRVVALFEAVLAVVATLVETLLAFWLTMGLGFAADAGFGGLFWGFAAVVVLCWFVATTAGLLAILYLAEVCRCGYAAPAQPHEQHKGGSVELLEQQQQQQLEPPVAPPVALVMVATPVQQEQ